MDRTVLPLPAPNAPNLPGPPISPRWTILRNLIMADAAARQADPPTPAVLSLYLPVWDDKLSAIPDAALEAIGRQALRDHASPYPLAAGDVLKTWQEFAPVRPYMPSHPFLLPGGISDGPPTDPAPAPLLTRLLTTARPEWGPPPPALVADLLAEGTPPLTVAAALGPLLRTVRSWADVAAVRALAPGPTAVGR